MIIKPVLDLLGVMSVSTISFLSGLSVMSMSLVSVIRQRKSGLVDVRTGYLLAAGAVIGGAAGSALFQTLKLAVGRDPLVGMVQALLLAGVTFLTLMYSAFLRRRLPSYRVRSIPACMLIGSVMGLLSAFLGIGGGPINLGILYFAFSMQAKQAAATSLYIILFSQLSSLLTSMAKGTIPEFRWHHLLVMTAAGIAGGALGTRVNKRISAAGTEHLFAGLLVVVILICFFNAWRFAG